MKKIVALVLALMMITAVFSGCGKTVGTNKDGKVHITIAAWPSKENNPKKYELYQKYLEEYKKLYPDVEVTTDDWRFDLKNYLVKAASKTLPTTFTTAPTELDTLVSSGYIKDLTSVLNKFGYLDGYNKDYSNAYLRDGKAYAVVDPTSVYQMGLVVNVNLFKQAGLVDKDGIPLYPETWEDVVEKGKTIAEKTGKAGFVFPTKGRHGGWEFLNIAWSYGADFVNKDKDGKYKAVFASAECAEALQFVKDLRWKHDILQDDLLADISIVQKEVGTGNAAMGILQSSMATGIPKSYGTDKADIAMCRIPMGPKGRYAISSANIYVVDANATDKEVEALMNWFNLIGMGPEVNDDMIKTWEDSYRVSAEEGEIVGIKPTMIWKDGERKDSQIAAMDKYVNVDKKFFEDYTITEGINFRGDPEKCAQELYDVLDSAIQNVLNNKDADVNKILKEAENNFQINFLDKE